MKSKNVYPVLLSFLFLFAFTGRGMAQKNNGWRGPSGDGKAGNFKIPAKWPSELRKIWQVNVGFCDASPVLVNGKIFLHVKQESNEVALCLNASDGKEVWKTTLNASLEITGPAIGHPGPRSTPFVAGDKMFTLGASGIVNCLDAATGKVLWKNDSFSEIPRFYTSSSPLVVDKIVVYQLGGSEHGVAVAFDINNGKEIWKLEGIPTSYSSPSLMKSMKNTLLVQSETDLCGISTDGKLLWKIPCPTQQRFYNSNSPVYDGMNLFIMGQGSGSRMVSLVQKGDYWETKEVWANNELGVSFCTPVLKDGFLFGHEGKTGYLFCMNAKTGEKNWSDATSQNRFASIFDAGKVLVSLPATGNMIVFEPSAGSYHELARYKVSDDETYASPILDGNKIFTKDREMLTCWSLE